MYTGIPGIAFIPRFVQSRLVSDSLYQSHKAFHRRRHSDVSSLSARQSHLSRRPSNARTSSTRLPRIRQRHPEDLVRGLSAMGKRRACWFNPFVPSGLYIRDSTRARNRSSVTAFQISEFPRLVVLKRLATRADSIFLAINHIGIAQLR